MLTGVVMFSLLAIKDGGCDVWVLRVISIAIFPAIYADYLLWK